MSNSGQVRSPWRAVFGLLAVLVASLAFSSSALAAGAPKIYYSDYAGTAPTFTGATFEAEVNPNGAPTTIQFEYGPTTALGSVTAPISIGEGIYGVLKTQKVDGLNPNAVTYFRVSATNKFGTVQSGIGPFKPAWWTVKEASFPQSYSQSGSVTFKMPTVGTGSTIKCGISSGGGTIEAETGSATKGFINLYELGLSGCEWVGVPGCNPTSVSALKLDSSLRTWYAEKRVTTINFNSETCGWFNMTLPEQEPFRITKMPLGLYGHEKTMQFAANTKFGSYPVEITGVLNIVAKSGAELSWNWS
jgi:hypothetical protein